MQFVCISKAVPSLGAQRDQRVKRGKKISTQYYYLKGKKKKSRERTRQAIEKENIHVNLRQLTLGKPALPSASPVRGKSCLPNI